MRRLPDQATEGALAQNGFWCHMRVIELGLNAKVGFVFRISLLSWALNLDVPLEL